MTADRLDAIPPASWQRLNALGSVTPCTVCGEPSVDGMHANCAEPSAWPDRLTAPPSNTARTRRCERCHGKGWTMPTTTRPQCTRCAGTGIITWRTP
jgi:hypothetical protein